MKFESKLYATWKNAKNTGRANVPKLGFIKPGVCFKQLSRDLQINLKTETGCRFRNLSFIVTKVEQPDSRLWEAISKIKIRRQTADVWTVSVTHADVLALMTTVFHILIANKTKSNVDQVTTWIKDWRWIRIHRHKYRPVAGVTQLELKPFLASFTASLSSLPSVAVKVCNLIFSVWRN